jgi:hypothetical protein
MSFDVAPNIALGRGQRAKAGVAGQSLQGEAGRMPATPQGLFPGSQRVSCLRGRPEFQNVLFSSRDWN